MKATEAPPVGGAFPFIFTDESGVVVTSQTEPFYGVGMIKLADAGRWADDLNLIRDRFVSAIQERITQTRERRAARGEVLPPRPKFPRSAIEFHFAEIKIHTRRFYEELVDYFVSQQDGYFCALVIDKRRQGIDPMAACHSSWDALITYSLMLLKNNIGSSEKAIVISDNYQKPRNHPHYFERQVVRGLGARAANVVMMDSSASIFLQLVDVLLGCVMYHYKMPVLTRVDSEKKAVADRLAAAYGIGSFAARGNFRLKKPNYLSVWPFSPRYQIVRT